MQTTPFHRSRTFARRIAIILAMPVHLQAEAFKLLGDYVSRGHGRNVRTSNKTVNSSTNWASKLGGQTCGKRECARRISQMKKGE